MSEPRQFFLDTLQEFYAKLSNIAFWESGRAQEIAVEALYQDYYRTEHEGYGLQDATSFKVALSEYSMRKDLMVTSGGRKPTNERDRHSL